MRVLVAGGAGFVGHHLVPALLKAGHRVTVLTRKPWYADLPKGTEYLEGDVLETLSYRGRLAKYDAIINLVAIIREDIQKGITYEKYNYVTTKNLADAARDNGVKRWIQMSANGAAAEGVSAYQSTKFRAEEYLQQQPFKLTIFRPSLIFGKPSKRNTEFCSQMADMMKSSPFVPVLGDGSYQLQPVSIEEVVKCFVSALEDDRTIGKTYHLGGPQAFTYREILETIRQASGISSRLFIPLPYGLVRPIFSLLGGLQFSPASVDQTDMLIQGNVTPESDFRKDLKITAVPFTPENLSYLKNGR